MNYLLKYKSKVLNPYIILTFIVYIVFTFIRFRLINIPLERDEGEYAYAGQLILNGSLPYTEMYNMKMPGIYFFYSFILLFGQTIFTIHLALIVANTFSAYLIYKITNLLFDKNNAGYISAISFLSLSITPLMNGLQANSEQFVLVFLLPSIFFLIKALRTSNVFLYFLVGIFSSIAFLIKQHSFAFIFFIILYIIISGLFINKIKHIIIFKNLLYVALGGAIPALIIVCIYYFTGNFEKFWFFTVQYAQEYIGYTSALDGPSYFVKAIMPKLFENKIFWALPISGLIFITIIKRKHLLFVLMLLFFSYVAISPGNYFRPHYFILFLPSVAILSGGIIFLLDFKKYTKLLNVFLIFIVFIGVFEVVIMRYDLFFKMTKAQAIREIFNYSHPFDESYQLGQYLNKHNNNGDYLTVIGAEPQLFFYTKLKSTTGYIYFYPLYEDHPFANKMIDEMIEEVESKQSEHLIFLSYINYMGGREENRERVKNWSKKYINKNYYLTGYIKINENSSSIYNYANTDITDNELGEDYFKIYKRKSN